MQRLKDKMQVPPGGFKYFQPESRATVSSNTWDRLIADIREHRIANSIPIGPLFDAEIQDSLCAKLPAGCPDCEHYDPNYTAPPTVPTTFQQAITFLKVMTKLTLRGRSGLVDKAEADRRAGICRGCPLNKPIDGCTTCRNLVKYVAEAVGNLKAAGSESLEGCAVCGCENRAAVWIDKELQLSAQPAEVRAAFPSWCWKRSQ